MLIRAINYALAGINRNMHQAGRSARRIAGAAARGTGQARPPRISQELVEMMEAEKAVEGNIAALRAAGRTLGSLVDISA